MKKITKVTFYQRFDENKESGERSKFHLRPVDALKEDIYSFVTEIKITVHMEEERERRTYTRRRMVWNKSVWYSSKSSKAT